MDQQQITRRQLVAARFAYATTAMENDHVAQALSSKEIISAWEKADEFLARHGTNPATNQAIEILRNDTMTPSLTMPSNAQETLVQLCWVAGDREPFICGAIGSVTVEMLSQIEEDCRNEQDDFIQGDGTYLFRVNHQPATFFDGGLMDPEHWELELVSFEPLES